MPFFCNMKRLLILFVVIVTALSLLALPIAADEASDTDEPKQTTSVSNDNNNNGNKNNNDAEVNKDIIKYFTNPLSLLEFVEIDISTFKDGSFWETLKNGGYNYFEGENNYINLMISKIYNITYPVGIVVMVLSWIFGIAKNSTNTALDIKDKNSLIRSMLGLVIGLAAMTAAPYVLTVLTSISNWLCVRISSISINTWFNDVLYCKKLQNLCEDGETTINLFKIIEARKRLKIKCNRKKYRPYGYPELFLCGFALFELLYFKLKHIKAMITSLLFEQLKVISLLYYFSVRKNDYLVGMLDS